MAEVDVVALGAEAAGEDTNQTSADATEAIHHGKLGGLKGATLLQKETNLRQDTKNKADKTSMELKMRMLANIMQKYNQR